MLKALKWLDKNAEKYLSFLFYFYLFSIIFVEVLRRYLFDSSSTWGEETAIYAFLWMTYIAAAKGVKDRTHLSISIVVRYFNKKARFLTLLLSDVLLLVLSVVILIFSLVTIKMTVEFGQQMLGVQLPMWLAMASIPFGWSLIIIRTVQRSLITIKRYMNNEPIDSLDPVISS